MAVKGAKTINQYKILKWVEENFVSGSVDIEFVSETEAQLTDKNKDKINVVITECGVVVK